MFVIYSQLTHLLNCFAPFVVAVFLSSFAYYSIVCLLAFAYFYNGDLLVFLCFLFSCFCFKLLDKFVSAATLNIYVRMCFQVVFAGVVCSGSIYRVVWVSFVLQVMFGWSARVKRIPPESGDKLIYLYSYNWKELVCFNDGTLSFSVRNFKRLDDNFGLLIWRFSSLLFRVL